MRQSVRHPDRPYSIGCCEGLSIDILQRIASDLRIDIQIYVTPDRMFGGFDLESGNWTGMVKELMDGTIYLWTQMSSF